MEKVLNGIYATAMDMHIRFLYEEMDDEEEAEAFLEDWLTYGVPDGSELSDNILYFGDKDSFNELEEYFFELCSGYKQPAAYRKEIEIIKVDLIKKYFSKAF